MTKLRTLLVAAAVATAAAMSIAAPASAGSSQLVLKKYALPQLNVRVHPRIPKICLNPLSKGPGAKKCG